MNKTTNKYTPEVRERAVRMVLNGEGQHESRWAWRSFEAVEYATLEWVDWFNNRRLLEPIGNIPPAEAEVNFYAALERSDMAAKLRQISLPQTRRGSTLKDQAERQSADHR